MKKPQMTISGLYQDHKSNKRAQLRKALKYSNSTSIQPLPSLSHTKANPATQGRVRMATPGTRQDVSNKQWNAVARQTEALVARQTPNKHRRYATGVENLPKVSNRSYAEEVKRTQTREEKLRPFDFLTRVGGNTTQSQYLVRSESTNRHVTQPALQGNAPLELRENPVADKEEIKEEHKLRRTKSTNMKKQFKTLGSGHKSGMAESKRALESVYK